MTFYGCHTTPWPFIKQSLPTNPLIYCFVTIERLEGMHIAVYQRGYYQTFVTGTPKIQFACKGKSYHIYVPKTLSLCAYNRYTNVTRYFILVTKKIKQIKRKVLFSTHSLLVRFNCDPVTGQWRGCDLFCHLRRQLHCFPLRYIKFVIKNIE